MLIAVSSDEHTGLVDFLLGDLARRGYETRYFGPAAGEPSADWPRVTLQAAEAVRSGQAGQAIVLCWTGTGASIAANKIPGIRAALCADAETARGARLWNDANVLALSLRATTPGVAHEILDRWFETAPGPDEWNQTQIARIAELDRDRT